jgi:hypothetical protein
MENITWIDNVKLLPIYLLFIGTFGQASLEKFRSGGMPDWFQKQFEGTILNPFPGSLTIQYYLLAVIELSVVLLFLWSGIQLEFVAGNAHTFLRYALVLALFTFFGLGFGLRISGDYQGAANLFAYFGVTLLALLYVEQLA